MDQGVLPKNQTVTQILAQTHAAADSPKDMHLNSVWLRMVRSTSTSDLIEAVSQLSSEENHRPANIKALREGMISEIERQNANHIVMTMQSLDRSAAYLTWVSLALTVVGLILAGIQIWQSILQS